MSRQKRAKTGANPNLKEEPCIICDQIKCQGDARKFCICKESAAKTLLKAANFVGDVYAADVMYHNNYLNRYIKKFQ